MNTERAGGPGGSVDGADAGPPTGSVAIVAEAMAAWGRHDIDGVLAHVADDIQWHYQVGSPPVQGRDAMRRMLERLAEHQNDSRWRLLRSSQTGDLVFIEAVDDYRNPAGHRVVAPYAGVYRFAGELIAEWRDYVDLGLLRKGEEGEALPDYLAALVEAETEA